MDGEQDDESLAIEHFGRYGSQLPLGIHRIYVSHNGEIISTYTDPQDQTRCVHYPFLHDIFRQEAIQTVRWDELVVLVWFVSDADLAANPPMPVGGGGGGEGRRGGQRGGGRFRGRGG